jgi:hypothetical protein
LPLNSVFHGPGDWAGSVAIEATSDKRTKQVDAAMRGKVGFM